MNTQPLTRSPYNSLGMGQDATKRLDALFGEVEPSDAPPDSAVPPAHCRDKLSWKLSWPALPSWCR
jgi:hypothetical protein